MITRLTLIDCTVEISSQDLIVTESGKSFHIVNASNDRVRQVKIDNCVFKAEDGKKCDWLFELFENNLIRAFYVELKGTDLNGAYRQLIETLDRLEPIHGATLEKKCFISTIQSPSLTTKTQQLKKRMATNKGIILIVGRSPLRVDINGNVVI